MFGLKHFPYLPLPAVGSAPIATQKGTRKASRRKADKHSASAATSAYAAKLHRLLH